MILIGYLVQLEEVKLELDQVKLSAKKREIQKIMYNIINREIDSSDQTGFCNWNYCDARVLTFEQGKCFVVREVCTP